MLLSLEKWLESQKISSEATSCFQESFICHRAGAYEAALLFSYLGLMNVIRDRVLSSLCPAGIPAGHWSSIQENMRRAETWDKAAFEATQQKQPAPIFVVTDDLRHQVEFWKDRRNDCAHSKDNKITPAHVEALHAFIESNLNKFAVNGSRAQMARRIQEYYDASLTPPGTPIEPLVRDIPNAVLHDELPAFIAEISTLFDEKRNSVEVLMKRVSKSKLDFLNAAFQFSTPAIIAACTNFFLGDDTLLLTFFRAHPDKVSFLRENPEKVRRLWHELLFTNLSNDFPLLASMLRTRLIPSEQIEESLSRLIRRGLVGIPEGIDSAALEEHGFYEILERMIVSEHLMSGFDWANRSRSIIVTYLSEHPISIDLAKEICEIFNSANHPWHLASDLNSLFENNPTKKTEFREIVTTTPNLLLPVCFRSLVEEA